MKTRNRWVWGVMAAVLIGLPLAGCTGASRSPVTSSAATSEDNDPSVTSGTEVTDGVCNPLTGEPGYDETLLSQRPVAVMVNNVKASLPQKGISAADIVYELPVEGAITRLMAVFANADSVPTVGSVRSARHDFVELAKPLNAIYVHFGGSDAGFEAIKANSVDSINGLDLSKTAFFFDETLHASKAREHCWFTDGELIQTGIAKKGYRVTTDEPSPSPFHFISEEERLLSSYISPTEARKATAPLSGEMNAVFTYDEAAMTYEKQQFGQAHLDANTGEPVQVTNVFLLYPAVGLMEDGLHKEVDLSQGEGWYLSLGRAEKITFEKDSVDGLMKFHYAETREGMELNVNPGKTWVCIGPDSYLDKLVLE